MIHTHTCTAVLYREKMPKRKAVKQLEREDSELTPPPEGLLDNAAAVTTSSPGKKRKILKEEAVAVEETSPKRTRRATTTTRTAAAKKKGKSTAKVEIEEEEEAKAGADASPTTKAKTQRRSRSIKGDAKEDIREQGDDDDNNEQQSKIPEKKKRQSKAADKSADMLSPPLAARTTGHKLLLGAHVSASGGVHNSVLNSIHIGGNAFALFLKSQRKWSNPSLTDPQRTSFLSACAQHHYTPSEHIVPHGSYLVNLAHTEPARIQQAYTSYLDDLQRCERLGIKLYNIHPGNNQCNDRAKAIKQLAENINRAHAETESVVTLLENMAAGGNVLGSTFEDLRDIIALIEDKRRIGVCIDTCHAFAGGYDLRSPETFHETWKHFDAVVGMQYLKAMHLNDSKAPFASHRDVHANIGTGFLGLRAFHMLVNDERMWGLPLILETPVEVRDEEGQVVKDEKGKKGKEDKGIWAREIKMLEGLVGMDVEGKEFTELEARLQKQGEPERKRLAEQADRKKVKEDKKQSKLNFGGKGNNKKKRKKGEDEEEVDSENSGEEEEEDQ